MNSVVSILIPAYNAERWLAETLESALAQTWEPKEIIVVDDGSKDATLSVARRFASRGVKVISQQNSGASSARNAAFALSRGEYIQWLDADDLLSPTKVAAQVRELCSQGTRYSLSSCAWGSFYFRPGKARFCPTMLWTSLAPIPWLLHKFAHAVYMPPATWLLTRELAEKAGPWNPQLSLDDDGEYFCRVILASDRILFSNEAKVFYRSSGSASLSNSYKAGRRLDSQFMSMHLQISHLIAAENSEPVRAACVAYMQWSLMYFYPLRMDLVTRVQQLAQTMGGNIAVPQLRNWKFAWLQRLVGAKAANGGHVRFQRFKTSALMFWDRLLASGGGAPKR